MSPTQRRLTAVALAVIGLGFLAHVMVFNFVGDDAYISFRYAENLARHGQLVFNLGERVEGYTNFLWTVLLAGFIRLHVEPAQASRLLGATFGLAALTLTYLLVRRMRGDRPRPLDLLAPALCAATPAFVCWSSGGLETQMFTALVLLGLWLYLGERLAGAGLALAAAAMTRPEGMMLFALVAAHLGARRLLETVARRRLAPTLARDLRLVAAFAVPFGLYYLWRWHYYGWPFPNTYYVKGETPLARMLPWGGRYLESFALDAPVLAAGPLLGLLALLPAARCSDPGGLPRTRVFSLLYLVLVAYVAYVAAVGGDFMALHRFLVPVVPLAAILAGEGVRALVALARSRSERTARPVGVALAAVALAVTGLSARRADAAALAESWPRGDTLHQGVDTVGYLASFATDRVVLGRWLRTHLPADTSIVVGAAGAMPYESRLPIIDGLGLADLTVAHAPGPSGDRPGHQKSASLDYLLSRRPAMICFGDGAYLGPADLSSAPPESPEVWRQRGYAWGCLHPDQRSRGAPLYYCCWHRLDAHIDAFARSSPEVAPWP